jgi:hypothetical protein
VPLSPVIDQAGNLTIALVHAPLKVVNTTCFSAFAHELLINNKTDMTLRGSLLASKVSTSIGDLNITGIPIRTAIELKGANQFADALSVNHVALLRGGPEGVTIKFNITVRNPLPNVAMNAGTLVMNMRHENVVIAKATVAKFNLALGTTTLSGEGLYTHPEGAGSAVATDFISTFVMGGNNTATLTNGVTDIPVLAYALGDVNISTTIPGNPVPLIQKADIKGVSIWAQTLQVVFYAYNPFDAYIAIDYLNFTVCLSGGNVVIGNIDLNLTAVDKVVYLPGHTAAASVPLNSKIDSFAGAIEALIKILFNGGETNVDIKGDVHILVFDSASKTESYGLKLHYAQQNIPAYLFGAS